jgi:hypothetical protein
MNFDISLTFVHLWGCLPDEFMKITLLASDLGYPGRITNENRCSEISGLFLIIKFPPKNRREFSLTLKTTNMKSVEIIHIYT